MNRNPDSTYSNLPEALRFALGEWVKGLNTCLPGHIVSYNSVSRRAVVWLALDALTGDNRRSEAPEVSDVPVIFPSGREFELTFPLVAGDPVLLVFAQRGLTGFKRVHGRSTPDIDSLFSLRDAIAIPGFGLRPPNAESTHAIEITSAGIHLRTSGSLTVTDSQGTRTL